MSTELGDFLRARRAGVSIDDTVLAAHGRRRVTGLRREEVAVLAGVSADYFARLEQGREHNPSAQVVDALARALHLDAQAREHLHRLARSVPDDRPVPVAPDVSVHLAQLIEGYRRTPAFVLNRALDVLATNAAADALFSPFMLTDNLVRMVFLDPAGRTFYADWDRAARAVVSALALATGHDGDHRVGDLAAELSDASERFAALWAVRDVRGKGLDAKRLEHPDVGRLDLVAQTFDVRDAPGQQLVIYQAEPRSRSAESLELLGTVAATRRAGRLNSA